MSFTKWKFVHKDSTGVETELSEAFEPTVTKSLGDGRDTFQIKLNNIHGKYDNYFNPSDNLLVYRDVNVSTASSLVMNAIVQDSPQAIDHSKDLIRVKGADYSDTVMGALVFLDATNLRVDEAITQVINSIRTINPNFPITEASGNPSVMSDGSDFPVVGRKYYYKTAVDVIDELLSAEFTGDGLYYWYVNKNNEFVWARRGSTVATSFNADQDEYYSLDISKDTKGVKNYIIIKGGTDPKGNPIQTRYFDTASMNKHGAKYDIITDRTTYAQEILGEDRNKAGVDSMEDASFPFTPSWTSSSYDTYNAYVEALRAHVKKYLKEKARSYVERRKYGKLKLELLFPVGKQWTLGSLIKCTVPSLSSSPKQLRVERVRLDESSEKYTLVEDIGTL